jgi:Helix-turn-helix domain/RodZ C-terminal domain
MFEIGSSLRAARMRQGLELSQVEHDTRIRARYLAALEDERFDVLPAPAYAKGFLRTYADYLGLDAQRFVDEFNARFAPEEEPAAPPRVRIRRRRFAPAAWLLVVVALAAGSALVAWRLSSSGGNHATSAPPPTQTPTTTRVAPPAAQRPATRPAMVARIVLVAARGRCWLAVRRDSATGRLIYEGTLEQGRTARFSAPRLWIRIGAPWNVDATLNRKAVQLPASTGDLVVTPAGLTTPAR